VDVIGLGCRTAPHRVSPPRREVRSAEMLLPRDPVAGIRGVKPAPGPSRKLMWAVCIGSIVSSMFMRCWKAGRGR
jgi:hypothetical protein